MNGAVVRRGRDERNTMRGRASSPSARRRIGGVPARCDDHIRDFYGAHGGSRMFDWDLMTPAVVDYLRRETAVLDDVLAEAGSRHLFEVGCGYGRHLRWAAERGYAYDGLDLVAWLVEQGRREVALAPPRGRAKLHVGTCEKIDELWRRERLASGTTAPVVLFPFNCFGNVADPAATARALARTNATVFLSLFDPSPLATRERAAYYHKTEYTLLSVTTDARGVLCRSREGLHSYAYEPELVTDMFRDAGFELRRRVAIAPVASGYVFHKPA